MSPTLPLWNFNRPPRYLCLRLSRQEQGNVWKGVDLLRTLPVLFFSLLIVRTLTGPPAMTSHSLQRTARTCLWQKERRRICYCSNLSASFVHGVIVSWQVFRWLMQLKNTSGLCCPTRPILASPVTDNYRNKCGFTIGRDLSGEPTVGFRLGKYK